MKQKGSSSFVYFVRFRTNDLDDETSEFIFETVQFSAC